MNEQEIASQDIADITGPFYDVAGLGILLEKDEDEILRRAENFEIISVIPSDGGKFFPAWQFEPDGTVKTELLDVANTLNRGLSSIQDTSGWTTAVWLITIFPLPADDGYIEPEYVDVTPLPMYKHLQNGTLVEDIKWFAQDDVNRWTSP